MARAGRLYPAEILHGADQPSRQEAAITLARTLLCAEAEAARPCGTCAACRRLTWPAADQPFHPDLHVLERDRRTVTSVDATKSFLGQAYQAPFEARGQVFVIAEAESLMPGAADALLKILEEPPTSTPRHFLLLAATQHDLLPTVRSRALSIFLGARETLDPETVAERAEPFGAAIDRFFAAGAAVDLLVAADALGAIGGWPDARARRPWATAAATVVHYQRSRSLARAHRRALLDLAADLLDAPRLRLRGIPFGRILEGLLSRHLAHHAP